MVICSKGFISRFGRIIAFNQLWDFYAGNQPSDKEVEQLVQDVENYTLADHLFWGLWGIISVHIFSIYFCMSINN